MKDPLEEAGLEFDARTSTRVLVLALLGLVALFVFRPGSRTPLLLIAGIVLLIMVHEAGHYITAKRAGMKVTEFFLGFGPRLWSFRRGETEYGIKAIPAGGYVRIIGISNLEDIDPDDEARTFRAGRFGDRLTVILAGVTVNILIAFLLFFVVIAGQGQVVDGQSTKIVEVTGNSAASDAGFRPGDRIVALNGRAVHDWATVKRAIEGSAHQKITVTVVRHGREVQLAAVPRTRAGHGFLGVSPANQVRDIGAFEAVPESFRLMGDVTTSMFGVLGDRFSPSGVRDSARSITAPAPKAGATTADLSRPRSLIGIVDLGSQLVGTDVWGILALLAQISLILALFNLLPLVPFDGGHAAVVLYEWAASKVKHHQVRVDYRKLIPVSVVVLLPLLFIALSAMVLDVRQLGQ
ncbi:MAG TPA: M50 family metallopeptidase [Acidimicrobiia bacterium]